MNNDQDNLQWSTRGEDDIRPITKKPVASSENKNKSKKSKTMKITGGVLLLLSALTITAFEIGWISRSIFLIIGTSIIFLQTLWFIPLFLIVRSIQKRNNKQ